MKPLELIVTLWPSFPQFESFACDERIAGIRLNSAYAYEELGKGVENVLPLLDRAQTLAHDCPLYLDLKGRQLRVVEALPNDKYCEVRINHPIRVAKLPTLAVFKGGNAPAELWRIEEGGRRLVFSRGPAYKVSVGESLCIRDSSLEVKGTLSPSEQELTSRALNMGFDRYMLSFVERAADITEFRKYIGASEVVAKIESRGGMRYVKQEFAPEPGLSLMAARGDLFVELPEPQDIIRAQRAIVKADPDAIAASRIMLSVTNEPRVSCSDYADLVGLLECGYHRLMLCDGLCLKEDALNDAIDAIEDVTKTTGYELIRRPKTINVA